MKKLFLIFALSVVTAQSNFAQFSYFPYPVQYGVASGTNTYTVPGTSSGTVAGSNFTSYFAGLHLIIQFTNGNTGASTVNINSKGAKAIKKNVTAALVSGDIIAGGVYDMVYDGSNFQIGNAVGGSGGGGSGTVTSVGLTAGTGISVGGTNPVTTSGTISVTNTAPDQTVTLTSGTGISTTGTYPNFTITNTSPSSGGTVTSIATTSPITGGTITGTGTIACATCGVTGTGLGQFASTSSSTLAGIISDETGSAGNIVFSSAPTLSNPVVGTQATTDNSTKGASTAYVTTAIANAIAAVNPAVAVQAATAAVLPNSPTYLNGASGIGATLTAGVTNTTLVVDGYTPALNERLLVKNQASSFQNGVYFVSQLASLGFAWIITRALDYNQPSDMNNTGAIPVTNGTVNATTSWVQTSQVTTVGTDAVTFAQFSYAPSTIITTSTSAGGSLTGTYPNPTIAASAVTNAMLAGSISNANLTNSSLTIGSTNISLGATSTTLAGLTSVTSTTFVGALTGNATTSSSTTGNAATVTTNANLTGDVTSVGNATTLNGGWVLLSSQTASSSATIDFGTSLITSTYSQYKVEIEGYIPATDNTEVWIRVGTGVTPTYDTGNNYAYGRYHYVYDVNTTGAAHSVADSKIVIVGAAVDNGSTSSFTSTFYVWNPSQTTRHHIIRGNYNIWDVGATLGIEGFFGAAYKSTTAITAIRVMSNSGNIASGNFKLYGQK